MTATKAAAEPTRYDNKTSQWAKWVRGAWNFDCCRSIKSFLWGFCFNKEASHGGAIWKHGYPDYTCKEMIDHCEKVSTVIKKDVITPGELLYTSKPSDHVGLYLGNGNVFECAPSLKGCAITDLSYQRWEKHGRIAEVDYGDTPAPAPTPDPELKAGELLFLRNEPLYASSSRKEASCCINGEVFLTDGKLVRGRVRVCRSKEDVGKIDKVLGWIDWRWKK